MPELPKYEDWTPPWGDGELDAEKAKKLIYNLHKDKAGLQAVNEGLTSEIGGLKTKVKDFETKDMTEVERLKRENEELKTAKPKEADPAAALDVARLRIALRKGLTEKQAARLQGKDEAELDADADAYIEEHGLTAGKGEDEGKPPPSNRPKPKAKTGVGGEDSEPDFFDPAKLQAELSPRR